MGLKEFFLIKNDLFQFLLPNIFTREIFFHNISLGP